MQNERLPVFALVLLTLMGFILVTAETMPAGLLPEIARGLRVSEGSVGLLVSAYAIGTVVVTVPAIALTRGWRRKPLILGAIAILIAANSVTALSPALGLSLTSRVVAGAMSGIIWGMFATYARRISPRKYAGRSLAIVSAGAPIGFALGTPLGSLVGTEFGWRWAFGGLSIVGLVVLVLIAVFVPDAAGQVAERRMSLPAVLRIRGLVLILLVIATWMIAHNTIYTYISPYLRITSTGLSAGAMLFIYGVAAIVGVVITGALLDRHPRPLLHVSAALFVIAGIILLIGGGSTFAVIVAAVL